MSRPGTRGYTKALNAMSELPERKNYRILAGKATRKNRGPKVNKKSVKSRKVPREVRNAIKQVQMRFGKRTIKRGKKAPKNKGKYMQARRAAAANLFRREGVAAAEAHENLNFARAIEELDARFDAEAAARNEVERAQAQAAALRARAAELDARAAAGVSASAAYASRAAGEPAYARASFERAHSPHEEMPNNSDPLAMLMSGMRIGAKH
jgi:hypothetical protein